GGKPVGYYVEEGQRLEELNRGDGTGNFYLKPNGVFFGTDGRWKIRTSTNFLYNVSDRPQFGTQSGPMLVIDGQLHSEIQDDGPSKIVRNGVGIDAEGRAHFVISDGALSFGQLARYFRDELKTPNALYLDGGISGLWDPVTERMDDTNSIGPLIVVTKKVSQ
ncbi:MAG: phosphodiester glycosidase family protein, partial [Altererythrobacter sp.]|nr:phosphodiester glycosidase family protein [Altererythrobacter sp.]